MARPIPRPAHGVLDYLYAAAFALSPHLFGFTEVASARWAAYGFGAVVLISSLLTRYELGLAKVLPFRLHLTLDLVGGVLSIAAPWALVFATEAAARNLFVEMGIISLVVMLLTRWEEMPMGRVVAG